MPKYLVHKHTISSGGPHNQNKHPLRLYAISREYSVVLAIGWRTTHIVKIVSMESFANMLLGAFKKNCESSTELCHRQFQLTMPTLWQWVLIIPTFCIHIMNMHRDRLALNTDLYRKLHCCTLWKKYELEHFSQAAAGMGIYGPRTIYCIAINGFPGCHEFLLQDDGKWLHVKETTEIGNLLSQSPHQLQVIVHPSRMRWHSFLMTLYQMRLYSTMKLLSTADPQNMTSFASKHA